MKVSIKMAAATIAMATLLAPAWAAPQNEPEFIGVVVDGESLFPPQQPVMQGGRTLIPMRSIFEGLGATVKWDGATKTITAKSSDESSTIVLTLNSTEAIINEHAHQLEAAPVSINNVTMVPLRFVGEALGAKVAWDGVGRMIRVASNGYESTLSDGDSFKDSTWDYDKNLSRIQVGTQAGFMRILNEEKTEPLYSRVSIDMYSDATVTADQRQAIYSMFGLDKSELRSLSRKLIANYNKERKYRLQLLGLLGILGSESDDTVMDKVNATNIQAFLVDKLNNGDKKLSSNDNNVLRRHAIINLGHVKNITPQAVEAVINCFETCTNAYVLSPVPFFLKSHSEEIKAMPKIDEYRRRIAAVQNISTAEAVSALQ